MYPLSCGKVNHSLVRSGWFEEQITNSEERNKMMWELTSKKQIPLIKKSDSSRVKKKGNREIIVVKNLEVPSTVNITLDQAYKLRNKDATSSHLT
jgi:hypothetical protein